MGPQLSELSYSMIAAEMETAGADDRRIKLPKKYSHLDRHL